MGLGFGSMGLGQMGFRQMGFRPPRRRPSVDDHLQPVVGDLVAARGAAHKIDAHPVVAARRQSALELVAGAGADEHRLVLLTRRDDVEVVGPVVGGHADVHGLALLGAEQVVDGHVALDSALDGGAVGAFGEVYALGVDVAGQGAGGD